MKEEKYDREKHLGFPESVWELNKLEKKMKPEIKEVKKFSKSGHIIMPQESIGKKFFYKENTTSL